MLRRLLTLFQDVQDAPEQPETTNPDPDIVETTEVNMEDFLDPYRAAEVAGERFRRQYADTPLFGETVAATGTEPLTNSQAGLQTWKGAVR